MSDRYDVEYDGMLEGLRCVVVKCKAPSIDHRCGYVGIPASHCLYGKDYTNQVKYTIPDSTPIGKRGYIDLLLYASKEDKTTCEVSIIFDVHGGITYAGGDDYPIASSPQLWWFGFDTGQDRKSTRLNSSHTT
jgi:hypothetical protein